MKGRKINLPDEVHDRLWLLARQLKQSVFAVANDLLDRPSAPVGAGDARDRAGVRAQLELCPDYRYRNYN